MPRWLLRTMRFGLLIIPLQLLIFFHHISKEEADHRRLSNLWEDVQTGLLVPLLLLLPLLAFGKYCILAALQSTNLVGISRLLFLGTAAVLLHYFKIVLLQYFRWLKKKAMLYKVMQSEEIWVIEHPEVNDFTLL